MGKVKEGGDSTHQSDVSSDTVQSTGIRRFLEKLVVRKNIETMLSESENTGFKKNLNAFHLIMLGIGCIIGAGIFVYSGLVAAKNAGPAVVLCFIISGFVATLSALCYSELSSLIPVSGSSYSYTYSTVGELVAWLVGWAIILEYTVGTAAVSVGWSGYLTQFFKDAFQVELNPSLVNSFVKWDEATSTFSLTGHYFNLPAILIITILTILLIVGTKESATATAISCSIKLVVILVFIFACASDVDVSRYTPFLPEAEPDYYGHFGPLGVIKGASVVFFCYTGFDSVSTAAQEAKNPKRDMPIGIVGSLIVCTILYISVSIVLVGIIDFRVLNVPQPITIATAHVGKRWLSILIGVGAVLGLLTSLIVAMMAQARVFHAMAKDGLLPQLFTKVHPKFKTPYVSQIIVWFIICVLNAIFPVDVLGELSGVGTLFAFFLVCMSVMILRIKRPDLQRSFKVPLGPYLIPGLGSITSLALIFSTTPSTLLRLVIWLLLGVVVYFIYGFRNSRLNNPQKWKSTHMVQEAEFN